MKEGTPTITVFDSWKELKVNHAERIKVGEEVIARATPEEMVIKKEGFKQLKSLLALERAFYRFLAQTDRTNQAIEDAVTLAFMTETLQRMNQEREDRGGLCMIHPINEGGE